MVKVAIIGYGAIAGVHASALQTLEARGQAKLVAVCDINPEQFAVAKELNIGTGKALQAGVNTYTDYKEMLEKEAVDLVDICVPTPFHMPITVDVLKLGYHVQCEKPMARTYAQTQEMLAAAKESGKILVIGLGLRFALEYVFVKEKIVSGEFGKPLAASFERMSGPPAWAWNNWYMKHEMSGGALLDLHIHDVDMVRFLFGEPKAVSCVTADVYSGDDIVHSRFYYDDLAVTAFGDWSQKGVPFKSTYCIAFEKATVKCENGKVVVYPRDGGEPWEPKLEGDNFFEYELAYMVDLVATGKENTTNPPESAAKTIRLAECLKKSADANGAIVDFA